MNYTIEKIDINNYLLFDDMVFWREHGNEREPSQILVSEQMKMNYPIPTFMFMLLRLMADMSVGFPAFT